MEIVNFFEKLAGRWFSQRTTHYLSAQQSQAGKSDLEIEWLPATDAMVQTLCGEFSFPVNQALGGLKVMQKSTLDGSPNQQIRTTLVVPLASESETVGKLLQTVHPRKGTPQLGQYRFENGVLSVMTEAEDSAVEERWWFISENLRMRTSVLKRQDGTQLASFCSEIRLGGVAPTK
jgi:hypothetical protein